MSLLNGVAPSTMRELGTAATTIALPPRRVIYKPGDPSNGLYVVLSGRVNLTLSISESKPRIVALLGPGAWFGETALLLRERHAIGAESAEAVMLARISSATVIRLLHADNVFALKMLTETSRRLRTSMTYWTDTDGVNPGVAGCHIGVTQDGKPNGRFFGEACQNAQILIESNPGAGVVHSHTNDLGHPDTFDCKACRVRACVYGLRSGFATCGRSDS